jgi:ABC-2 type transport system permease protein
LKRVTDIICVFRIQFAGTRREVGPFLLAAFVFPAAMYLFANAVAGVEVAPQHSRLRFLAGSIVFSLSLTSISWLGYLLLENRFTGRLKLFATLPLAPSSYVFGVLVFAISQAAVSTTTLLVLGRALGVQMSPTFPLLMVVILLTILSLCGLGVIVAARARSFSQGSLLTDTLGAGLIFLAPVYYAPEMMPRALRVFARLLPTTFAADAVQTTLAGGYAIGNDLLALSLITLITLALGFRLMKWRED